MSIDKLVFENLEAIEKDTVKTREWRTALGVVLDVTAWHARLQRVASSGETCPVSARLNFLEIGLFGLGHCP